MSQTGNHTPDIAPEEAARADMHGFLSRLLREPPSAETLAQVAVLGPGEGEIGEAVKALSALARGVNAEAVSREFHDLFIGVGRGELLPYASVYLTGFLNEKPLATLRNDMLRLGMTRADGVFEPEDNIASLLEMMAGLIRGDFGGAPASLAEQRSFFNAHLAPWAAHFFKDLEGARASVFYTPVGTLGRVFMAIEVEAFRMEAA